jgi:hypothetical protein
LWFFLDCAIVSVDNEAGKMHDELKGSFDAIFAELQADGYAGKHGKVLEAIQATRAALTPAGGKLGPWETELLAYADGAVEMSFLILALNATEKAIAVSDLPVDEYDFGFNYGKRKK